MAKYAGRKCSVQSAGAAIAGATVDSLTINREGIEATGKSDLGIRKYLAELGTFSMSMACSGFLDGDVLQALARDTSTGMHTLTFEITGLGEYSGSWVITSFEITGEEGASPIEFSASFESGSAVTWTAA